MAEARRAAVRIASNYVRLVATVILGLYLVREIVRLHRGSVDVKSLPGAGSVFSVRLPRHFGPPQAALA